MWRRTPARARTSSRRPSSSRRWAIHSVEARHAAWIRFINGVSPAPAIVDKPATEKAVLKAVTATGFIKG